MLSLLCFLLSLWVLTTQSLLVSNTSLSSLWFILLCGSAIIFYMADHVMWICLSWSLMGFSSQAIVGSSPTVPTSSAVASMISFSTVSTFLCFSTIFCTCSDSDQEWNLTLHFPSNNMSTVYTLISFISLSINSLLFPFSFWLFSAMKGVAVMSSLVHSLTIVFSGLFLTLSLLVEGYYWIGHVEVTSLLFIPSSIYHLFYLINESHVNSLLAWSTAFSVNLCHVALPWDPSFSMFYGVFHGMSNSFLFSCSQGSNNLSWSFLSGLLGGFPLSFVWNVKSSFIGGNLSSSTFFMWALLVYLQVFINLCFNDTFSLNNALFWDKFGHSWFSLAVLLSIIFL